MIIDRAGWARALKKWKPWQPALCSAGARLPVELVGIGGKLIPGAHGISVAAGTLPCEEMKLDEMDR